MNVERIFFWLRFVARLILDVLGEPGNGPEAAGGPRRSAGWPAGFKPERIQFWIGQLVRFILEVTAAGEETGKSGEPTGAPAPASEEVE